jgi:hypothetical protein
LQRYRGNHLDEETLRAIMEDMAQTADASRAAFGQIGDQRIVDMEFEEAVGGLANLPSAQTRDVFEAVFLKLRREARVVSALRCAGDLWQRSRTSIGLRLPSKGCGRKPPSRSRREA